MKWDAFIFGAVNAWLYLKHPYLVVRTRNQNDGVWPNIACPQQYFERMLWRKLVDRSPQFVLFCDKLATKEFITRRCPELALPETLWVGEDAAAIPPEHLHGDVWVKANHGCAYNFSIRQGQFDRAKLLRESRRWMNSRYGRHNGQWGYAAVKRKLFVEAAVNDPQTELVEFNVRASNGKVILGSIMGRAKQPDQWFAYLDPAGNPSLAWDDADTSIPRRYDGPPEVLTAYLRAVEFTRRLSVGVDYGRFDFMWNGRELFGGEVTMYSAGGMTSPRNSAVHRATLAGWDLAQAEFFKIPQRGWRAIYARRLLRRLQMQPAMPTSVTT